MGRPAVQEGIQQAALAVSVAAAEAWRTASAVPWSGL